MYIETFDYEGTQQNVDIDYYPDECPKCHYSISPSEHHYSYYDKKKWERYNCLQLLFRCSRIECQNLFIANYQSADFHCRNFIHINSVPLVKKTINFNQAIKDVSEDFCKIYNEAFNSEQSNLMEICGVGYRKSLEFLIKDYLIKINPEKKEEIEKKLLGECISTYIENENIKNLARRAAWLGNDETHYLRKWEGKNLQDLKNLINLTMHWIEMEELTKEAINDMPDSEESRENELQAEETSENTTTQNSIS